MCPRGRPQGQGRPRGLHLCLELTYLMKYPINLSLVAMLELTLHHPLPLRWRRHSIVSNQCKGECPPLQRPGVLAIVTFCQKDASQCGRLHWDASF